MSEAQNSSPMPYVIAVTGHRDLRPQDLEALRREIRSVLAAIRSRMPAKPLLLLTALAEGADQLVAEVALEQGIAIAAVLPMPLDIYSAQMPEDAQTTLANLLTLSEVRIALPLQGRTPEQIRTSSAVRAACYEALALYLVRHAQALIALWDGKHSDKLGGTCRVVHSARFDATNPGAPPAGSRCEVVYHIVTPRLSGPEPSPGIATVTLDSKRIHSATAPNTPPLPSGEQVHITHANIDLNLDSLRN